MQIRVALWLLRNRNARTLIALAALLVIFTPVLLLAAATSVIYQAAAQACQTPAATTSGQAAGGGPIAAGLYAQPLRLQPGRWYEVGATQYGGPEDPSSGDYGAIGDTGQGYLPAHPYSFAELSIESTNPANHGQFTFADANALGNLPYLTALRVAHDGHEAILQKRDIGYGQGPGERIANGEPYRLDLWWQAARPLGVSKSAVRIALAPSTGAASTLQQLPGSSEALPGATSAGCVSAEAGVNVPLPLVPGTGTQILPSGLAAAGSQAPQAIKNMVAAGNQLFGTSYRYGASHGVSLDTLQPAYDCSSAVSYLLHAGGVLDANALDSTGLAGYGLPGPGRYVSIYANAAHAFIYIAGLRFDTSFHGTDTGPNAGKSGARWRVSSTVPNWSTWTVRHPPGM
jgi:hypothetical protein